MEARQKAPKLIRGGKRQKKEKTSGKKGVIKADLVSPMIDDYIASLNQLCNKIIVLSNT